MYMCKYIYMYICLLQSFTKIRHLKTENKLGSYCMHRSKPRITCVGQNKINSLNILMHLVGSKVSDGKFEKF